MLRARAKTTSDFSASSPSPREERTGRGPGRGAPTKMFELRLRLGTYFCRDPYLWQREQLDTAATGRGGAGVRSSPGAATSAQLAASKSSSAPNRPEPAEPEDGRTPNF